MSHIETFLLVAMGFALASLIGVFILRAVWNHGERVGRRRVQRQIPTLDAELQADRTKLRAEIAMARRKAEYQVKEFRLQLAEKSSQLTIYKTRLDELTSELAERNDQISKMRTGRVPLEAELEDRTTALHKANRIARDLNDQIQRLKREVEAARAEIRQRDRVIAELKRSRGARIADVADVAAAVSASEAPAPIEPDSAPAPRPAAVQTHGSDLDAAQARLRERIKLISELSREIAVQRESLRAAGAARGPDGKGDSDAGSGADAGADDPNTTVVRLSSKEQRLAADLEEAGRSADQLRADLERLDEIWREKMTSAGLDARGETETGEASQPAGEPSQAADTGQSGKAAAAPANSGQAKKPQRRRKSTRKSAAAQPAPAAEEKKKKKKEAATEAATQGKVVEREKVVSLADKIRALQDEITQ